MPPVPQAGSYSVRKMPGLDQHVLVGHQQQVHHQPDDVARGEVLAGGLIGLFGETPDQLLVEVAHSGVRHGCRQQVEVGELRQDEVEHGADSEACTARGAA